MQGAFKTLASADNANLVDGRLFAKFAGLDARVGGIFFGDKEKTTINTLEDNTGPDLYIGREIFYASSAGTKLVQSNGQSTFGYVGLGYTLPGDVRVGVQGVFGQNTQSTTANSADVKNTLMEGVFELGWKANKSLSFEGYYSYMNSKKDGAYSNATNAQDTSDTLGRHAVRLQALYKF